MLLPRRDGTEAGMRDGELAELRELFEYNRWANERILDVVTPLGADEFKRDMRSSYPSIRDTLVHTLSAEWVWLSRWKGVSPSAMPGSDELVTVGAVRARWREVDAERSEYLDGLTEQRLADVIAYRNTRGEPYATPLWQMLRHVVNHSSYHRGQVTTMLRQLGRPAIATDLIVFYRGR
jgi:uncharacterized damage-inducible protein DinB